jgi:hypothetical protein
MTAADVDQLFRDDRLGLQESRDVA